MTPLYILPLQTAPEVIDRIPSGYSNFVIPFVVGISFMLIWLTVGLIRLLAKIPAKDRHKLWKSFFIPKIALKKYQRPVLRLSFPYKNLETQAVARLHALRDSLRMVHAHRPGTPRSRPVRP